MEFLHSKRRSVRAGSPEFGRQLSVFCRGTRWSRMRFRGGAWRQSVRFIAGMIHVGIGRRDSRVAYARCYGGKPVWMQIEDFADQWAFAAQALQIPVPTGSQGSG